MDWQDITEYAPETIACSSGFKGKPWSSRRSAIATDFMETDMVAGTIQLRGKRFVILPEAEYDRLRQRAAVVGDVDMPELPARLSSGNYPAIQAMRVALARKLIKRRWAARLSQAELARRSGVRAETLNRIEKAKVSADTATVTKIARALEKAEREASRES